ncbi:MAG: hypothetical protein ACRC7V_01640 [Lachnospiraceae bacterium]
MASAVMTTIYDHYLTAYSPKKSDNRFNTHKKDELRSLCNTIAKNTKQSPLYLLDRGNETKQFAIEIKDSASLLHNKYSSIAQKNTSELMHQQTAYSDNTDLVSVKYIGSDSSCSQIPSYQIRVESLASGQVNLGYFLSPKNMDLPADNYSFDVTINGLGYEFQFTVLPEDTNLSVQHKLSRLINSAGIGLTSSVLEEENRCALEISSLKTGYHFEHMKNTFSITDSMTNKSSNCVSYFGIDYVAKTPSNAHFTINGEENTSISNQFNLEKDYEITLNGVSSTDTEYATISMKPNTDALKDTVKELVNGYNHFILSTHNLKDPPFNSRRLRSEMDKLVGLYQNDLNTLGITLSENGTLEISEDILDLASNQEDLEETFYPLREFSSCVLRKSNEISLDPLNYAKKILVAYKNSEKTEGSPYVTSNYTGLLFNYYC